MGTPWRRLNRPAGRSSAMPARSFIWMSWTVSTCCWIFPEVIVPVAVRREVQRHRPEALDRPQTAWRAAAPGEPPSAELRALVRLLALHVGETAAIQIAMGHPGAMLLTDDTAARLAGILADLPYRSSLHARPGLLMSVIREVEAKDSP